jgi:hypothetical protein
LQSAAGSSSDDCGVDGKAPALAEEALPGTESAFMSSSDAGHDETHALPESSKAICTENSSGTSDAMPADAPATLSAEETQECQHKELPPDTTTFVIWNIPARYTPATIVEVWPADGSIDYIHIPYDHSRNRRSGYAFVNFTSHDAAVAFYKKWQGRRFDVPRARRLDIRVADMQGLKANLLQLSLRSAGRRRMRLRGEHCKYMPVVFDGPNELDLMEVVQSLGIILPEEQLGADTNGVGA